MPKNTLESISIVIPTYRRNEVLIDTINNLLALDGRAAEILVIDQTIDHDKKTYDALQGLANSNKIRLINLAAPSIPAAMNRGLAEAKSEVVLFLDDDIVPFNGLIVAHAEAHERGAKLVAGRVLQPWDGPVSSATWSERQFASTEACYIQEFIGCNFSVSRVPALELGGFDENFVRVAYNFEREFSDRWRYGGGRISFDPTAAIHHLKAPGGGTRTFGEHLRTLLPSHSVGAYYYLLRTPFPSRRLSQFLWRPIRAILTRHHLRRPWWIPVTLISELAGMLWAFSLFLKGPRYCKTGEFTREE